MAAAVKAAEAAKAKIEGLNAAQDVDQASIDAIGEQRDGMRTEIETLRDRLRVIGARDPEVRTVTEWLTREIEVPVDRLVEIPADCAEPEAPSLYFRIEGTSAQIVTAADNTFAVGVVELWRTEPEPEELLGTAPWETDVTELFIVETPAQKRRLRWTAMFGAVFADEASGVGYTAKLQWRATRRFGLFAGSTWSRSTSTSFDCDHYNCTTALLSGSDLTAEVGLTWSF